MKMIRGIGNVKRKVNLRFAEIKVKYTGLSTKSTLQIPHKAELNRAGRYFHTAMADQNKKIEKKRYFEIDSISATLF